MLAPAANDPYVSRFTFHVSRFTFYVSGASMPDKILVCVAWPYCNGDMHIGHIAGAYLPGDIFARYHRLRANEVLMVSGSDTHGTPITVRADEEGTTPEAVFLRFHNRFLDTLKQLGISFDLFT